MLYLLYPCGDVPDDIGSTLENVMDCCCRLPQVRFHDREANFSEDLDCEIQIQYFVKENQNCTVLAQVVKGKLFRSAG